MMDLMLDLNGRLRVLFECNWRCTIKCQEWCTWSFTWFNYEHVSALEGTPDSLSEDTPTFEVERVHFRLQLSYIWRCTWWSTCQRKRVHKTIKKKVNLRKQFMLHLKVHLRFHFKKHKKFQKNVTKKMHLSLQLMVHLTMQPRVHLLISDLTLDESFISSQSEKCPNTELFLVRIYSHSYWIRTRKNSVFGLFSRIAYIEQNKRNCYCQIRFYR